MKPSELAEMLVSLGTDFRGDPDVQDLARAHLRLISAAEWHAERGYLHCDCGENQYRSCDGCKLLLALEESDEPI
jgi:hypothetical protein